MRVCVCCAWCVCGVCVCGVSVDDACSTDPTPLRALAHGAADSESTLSDSGF